MRKRMRFFFEALWARMLILILTGLGVILAAVPGYAGGLPQVINPDDITTPTPTYEIILRPTSTATPVTPTLRSASGLPEMSRPGQVNAAGDAGQNHATTYTVREGDTLLSVALEVGVDVANVPCLISPDFRQDHPLVIGDELPLLPQGWGCHQVRSGETLAGIAAHYGLEPDTIYTVAWNALRNQPVADVSLDPGRYLRIPTPPDQTGSGFVNQMLAQPLSVSPYAIFNARLQTPGVRTGSPAVGGVGSPSALSAGHSIDLNRQETIGPLPENWPYGSGNFLWPVYGWLSQGYRDDHRALDIAAAKGTLVTAADRGVVIRAGWNDQGYGMFVIIDHNIDYLTLYSHLDDVVVSEGDVVAQGQVLGTVGSSGNSTGPHLHFEIRDFGRRTNPLPLLMR